MIKKVFIVDDDEISIFVLESFLVAENFADEFQCFQDAEVALQVIQDSLEGGLPDVIFLDLNMPLLNGWDFLEALQPYQEKLLGRSSIYILTSSVDPAEIKRAENYKLVAGFLRKPIDEAAIENIKKQHIAIRKV